MKTKKSKKERLEIVLEMIRKFKNTPKSTIYYTNVNDNPYVDLYNQVFPAMRELKNVFDTYVNQDDDNTDHLVGLSGKIKFPEINKTIHYVLPIKKDARPSLILRTD